MSLIGFPQTGNYTTPRTVSGSSLSSSTMNGQIEVLERRDSYLLDLLSSFDAIPIGMVFATTVQYDDDNPLPEGWIFANGQEISEADPDDKEIYDTLVANIPNMVTVGYDEDYENDYKNNKEYYGKFVRSLRYNRIRVPNLNNLYLRGASDESEIGKYFESSVQSHEHKLDAGLSSAVVSGSNMVVSLIPENDGVDPSQSESTTPYTETTTTETSIDGTETNESTETRPNSIGITYLIKVKFTDLISTISSISANSITNNEITYWPTKTGNISYSSSNKYWFPIADENGLIDPKWLDPEDTVEHLSGEISNLFEEQLSDSIVFDAETSTTSSASKVIKANTDGMLDTSWLPYATNALIESLFDDLEYPNS